MSEIDDLGIIRYDNREEFKVILKNCVLHINFNGDDLEIFADSEFVTSGVDLMMSRDELILLMRLFQTYLDHNAPVGKTEVIKPFTELDYLGGKAEDLE